MNQIMIHKSLFYKIKRTGEEDGKKRRKNKTIRT